MLDFVSVKATSSRRGVTDIYPEFIAKKSKDLMIRGRAFYAIWDEEQGLWSRSEYDAVQLIDRMIFARASRTASMSSMRKLYLQTPELNGQTMPAEGLLMIFQEASLKHTTS